MLALLALLILSCFSSEAISGEYKFHAKFVNEESTIILETSSMYIDGESYEVRNCSDENFYCYKQSKLGFFIYFPKKCGEFWSRGGANTRMRLTMVYPHSDMNVFVSIYSSKFLYLYSDSGGLMAIYYDHGKNLMNKDRSKLSIDYQLFHNMEYEKVSDGDLFQCH